jgi:acetyl esterase/lipase
MREQSLSLLGDSPALAAALAIVLVLAFQINLHYKLLGGSFIEGLLASRLARLGNGWWCQSTRKKMDAAGIPRPRRTIEYVPGLLLDVYDLRSPDKTADVARCGATAAPAVLYFHAGAFLVGGREFGAGTLSWLAEQGLVGISVGYRLTSDAQGRGIAGCIASAWAALRFVRAHADELGIDPSQIIAMGDSAGGLLALALATGLRGSGGGGDAALVERPLAAVAGWGCCTIESRSFAPVRTAGGGCGGGGGGCGGGGWEDTPAAAAFPTPCIFVPEGTGATAAAAQRQLQTVLSGSFLAFGRRARGWLPASSRSCWPADDGASVSPLSRASEPGMAPTLLLVGGSDEQVPYP